MLQQIPSRYQEMKESWIALAQEGDACKSIALALLDQRSEWQNHSRHLVTTVDGHTLDIRETQIALDTVVENFVHISSQKPGESVQLSFLSGKRLLLHINGHSIVDQTVVEEIAPEILNHARVKVAMLRTLVDQIA